jgi:hypothetical protein
MPDDRAGRDKQAHDEEKRQRLRDLAEELERRHETEPPIETATLDEIEAEAASMTFPATGAVVVETVGKHRVTAAAETYTVADLVPDTETVTFDSAAAVRARVKRPSVARTLKRIVEAGDGIQNAELRHSQWEAYERTLRALVEIDADDDDETVRIVGNWIIEQVEENEAYPSSRRVRKEAAAVCRRHGYEIRDDEWLGA